MLKLRERMTIAEGQLALLHKNFARQENGAVAKEEVGRRTGQQSERDVGDVQGTVKTQMLEHRLNSLQQKVESLNPVFLLTIESKLEELSNDVVELRNLYSSPTSSLNLLLDGLLKKVKELETVSGELTTNRDRSNSRLRQDTHQSVGGNERTSYTKLAGQRINDASSTGRGVGRTSSVLKGSALMQMNSHRASLN